MLRNFSSRGICRFSLEDTYTNLYSNITHNSPKLEIIWMSIIEWAHELWFIITMEYYSGKWINLSYRQKHRIKQMYNILLKESRIRRYILFKSIYISFKNRLIKPLCLEMHPYKCTEKEKKEYGRECERECVLGVSESHWQCFISSSVFTGGYFIIIQ